MAKDDVVMKIDAQTAAFVREVDKARQKLLQLEPAAEKASAKIDTLGTKFLKLSNAWGKFDVGDIGQQMASAFGIPLKPTELLDTAVKGLSESFEYMNGRADTSAQKFKTMEQNIKAVIQVSANLKDLEKNMAAADRMATKFGMGRGEALKIQTELTNAGMGEQAADTFGRASTFADSSKLIPQVKKIQENFGKDAGSEREILNMVGEAASKSAGTNLDNLMPAVVTMAQMNDKMGGTVEEAIAIASVAAESFKTGEIGGDRMNAVQKNLDKMGYGGKGLIAGWDAFKADQERAAPLKAEMAALDKRNDEIKKRELEIESEISQKPSRYGENHPLRREQRALNLEQRQISASREMLKSKMPMDPGHDQEFTMGAQFLERHRDKIIGRQKEVGDARRKSGGSDFLGQKYGDAQVVLGDVLNERSAEAEQEIADEELGKKRLRTSAQRKRIMAEAQKRGDSTVNQYVRDSLGGTAEWLGADEQMIDTLTNKTFGQMAEQGTLPAIPNNAKDVRPVLDQDKLGRAMEMLAKQSAEQNELLRSRKGTALENNSEGQK